MRAWLLAVVTSMLIAGCVRDWDRVTSNGDASDSMADGGDDDASADAMMADVTVTDGGDG
jgi:hypothetical protein